MSGPLDNVDEFRHRPVNAVAGLLPDPQPASEVVQALKSAGSDVSQIGVLHGGEGARILDRTGAEHGTKAKIVRFFQNWGYDEEIFSLYDSGLRKGEALLVVPCSPDQRYDVARLMVVRGGHDVYFFGVGSAEALAAP